MRLTTTFLLAALVAVSGCKMGMRQSADTGCAASCGGTVGYAKAGCTGSACTNGACTTGGCKTSCAATCVPAGQNGCVSGASGCCTTACGACGDTVSQAKAAAEKAAQLAAQPVKKAEPNPFATAEIQPTNAIETDEPAAEPASFEPQTKVYRHAEDYRWLVGQLQRVHTPGTEWKIRYAGLDEHDVWGGSMVLARDVRLDSFEDGQLVYVEGEILAERPSAYLAGPLYRMDVIRPVTEQDLIGKAAR